VGTGSVIVIDSRRLQSSVGRAGLLQGSGFAFAAKHLRRAPRELREVPLHQGYNRTL